MEKVYYKQYSEALRKKVVAEYEEGASIRRLLSRYGIGSRNTVLKWIKKYASEGLRHEVVVIQRAGEREQRKREQQELEERIKELEAALAQLTLDKLMLESIQQVKREARRRQEAEMVREMVCDKRRKHPWMGGRKLLHELREKLVAVGIRMGRERFFDLLRRANLLLRRRRARRRTTWAGSWRGQNLLAGRVLTGPNQAWARWATATIMPWRNVSTAS